MAKEEMSNGKFLRMATGLISIVCICLSSGMYIGRTSANIEKNTAQIQVAKEEAKVAKVKSLKNEGKIILIQSDIKYITKGVDAINKKL